MMRPYERTIMPHTIKNAALFALDYANFIGPTLAYFMLLVFVF